MKYLDICIIALTLALFSAIGFAALPELTKDKSGQKIQEFSPDGTAARSFTKNITSVDLRSNVKFAILTPMSSCKFKTMSTATNAGSLRYLPKGSSYIRGVNPKSGFLNTSSCTNGIGEFQ